ncbi:helix-turn-helix domain-containing protein [Catenuloplanes atrovinosus]|uniref:DNA-binding CsgD family transcriptional regulator n=1 Tax=Catenuloplanes atrovinosus TaxID=137266 RepID=A0AAE3YJQ4_9ACTN|nr:LuxR C-terminal-related transcriptional regulator [Catenuloplanes atrovinosus]MDR7273624.1 DNA-binding CsgD family transcriptional regulator [Catenuloplanes atrovinosus]
MTTRTCDATATTRARGRRHEWSTAIEVIVKPPQRLTILLVEGAMGTGKTRFLRDVAEAATHCGFGFLPAGSRTYPVTAKWWRESSAFADAVAAVLAAEEDDGPLLLAADDVHAAHIDLIRELFGIVWYRQRLPIVLALSRREQPSPVPEFERHLASADGVVRVRLGPLGPDAVVEVACDLLELPPGDALSRLLAQAAGNPLLLTELIKGLREERAIARVGGYATLAGAPPLPQRVLRLVTSLVQEFSPAAREVLRFAAAHGPHVDIEQLARVRAEPVPALLPIVDELLASGILTPDGDRLRYAAPLMRGAVLAATPRPLIAALRGASAEPADSRREPDARLAKLTESERIIAALAADGLTNIQIARRIDKSTHTVNFHLRNVFRKLGLRSRIELARFH